MSSAQEPIPPLPSDRSFGFTFAIVFAVAAAWLAWKAIPGAATLAAFSVIVTAIALVRPRTLHRFNRWWMAFGLLLHRFVSPIVLGLIYFGMFTPIAIVLRLRGRDAMRMTFDPGAGSYWSRRDPPGPPPESLKNQY